MHYKVYYGCPCLVFCYFQSDWLKNIMLHEHLTIDKWQKDQVLRSSNCVPLQYYIIFLGLSSSVYTIFNQSKRLWIVSLTSWTVWDTGWWTLYRFHQSHRLLYYFQNLLSIITQWTKSDLMLPKYQYYLTIFINSLYA